MGPVHCASSGQPDTLDLELAQEQEEEQDRCSEAHGKGCAGSRRVQSGQSSPGGSQGQDDQVSQLVRRQEEAGDRPEGEMVPAALPGHSEVGLPGVPPEGQGRWKATPHLALLRGVTAIPA